MRKLPFILCESDTILSPSFFQIRKEHFPLLFRKGYLINYTLSLWNMPWFTSRNLPLDTTATAKNIEFIRKNLTDTFPMLLLQTTEVLKWLLKLLTTVSFLEYSLAPHALNITAQLVLYLRTVEKRYCLLSWAAVRMHFIFNNVFRPRLN